MLIPLTRLEKRNRDRPIVYTLSSKQVAIFKSVNALTGRSLNNCLSEGPFLN